MSLEEKHWWAYGAIALVFPAIYFAFVLNQVAARPASQVAFQGPLLAAATAGVVLGIIVNIVLRISADMGSPKGARLKDERDRDIHRLGEYVAGLVLAVAMAVPFILALLEADHLWIASAMYLAFALWAFAGSAVKVVLYRRGF
jgi:hypothetical protein